jgi:hypothetical protein
MGIPESQLETWSGQGSITQSATTYATIKRALEAQDAGYAGRTFEIFLQGSYGNDTNIYSESDVDVVIRLSSSFWHDLSELPADQQQVFNQTLTDGKDRYSTYKSQVEAALRKSFGDSVEPGPKAFKVIGDGARRNADVVAAFAFRRYYRFKSIADQRYDEGMRFLTDDATPIVNYPEQHSENLTVKHQATGKMFKPLVRILKNMRSVMVESNMIGDSVAPSYFIEGLLYNVPNEMFAGDYTDAFVASIDWLLKADRKNFVCANEQYYLLRETPVTWSPGNCNEFLDALVKLWGNW